MCISIRIPMTFVEKAKQTNKQTNKQRTFFDLGLDQTYNQESCTLKKTAKYNTDAARATTIQQCDKTIFFSYYTEFELPNASKSDSSLLQRQTTKTTTINK